MLKKIKAAGWGWLKKIIYRAEEKAGRFFTFHARPMRAEKVRMKATGLSPLPAIAVVIQGPIDKNSDFTLETIKIYRRHWPEAILILSTWEDEDDNYLAKIKDLANALIKNPKPAYGGIGNINFQLASSIAGIKKAKELGAAYVLKTRADQRIYSANCLEYFYNLTRIFPVAPGFKQNQRIITISLDTIKNRMYGISDMAVFGQIDDMLIYWGLPAEDKAYLEAKNAAASEAQDGKRGPLKQNEFPVCEQKICSAFLEKIGRRLTWEMEDSNCALAENFCIADQEDIDLYWHKYARLREKRHLYYNQDNFWDKHEVYFADWFNLYSAFKK